MIIINKYLNKVNTLKNERSSRLERNMIYSDKVIDFPLETRLSVLTAGILKTNNNLRASFTQQVKQHEELAEASNKLKLRLEIIKNDKAIIVLNQLNKILDRHKSLIQKQFTELMRKHKELSNEMKNLVEVIYGKDIVETVQNKVIEEIRGG